MRPVDADEIIRKAYRMLNKGVYRAMLVELVNNTPTLVDSHAVDSRAFENGRLERFISDCCVDELNARVRAGDLIDAYKQWARSVGEYEGWRGNEMYKAMVAAGYQQIKPGNKRTWLGLRLKSSCEMHENEEVESWEIS